MRDPVIGLPSLQSTNCSPAIEETKLLWIIFFDPLRSILPLYFKKKKGGGHFRCEMDVSNRMPNRRYPCHKTKTHGIFGTLGMRLGNR